MQICESNCDDSIYSSPSFENSTYNSNEEEIVTNTDNELTMPDTISIYSDIENDSIISIENSNRNNKKMEIIDFDNFVTKGVQGDFEEIIVYHTIHLMMTFMSYTKMLVSFLFK